MWVASISSSFSSSSSSLSTNINICWTPTISDHKEGKVQSLWNFEFRGESEVALWGLQCLPQFSSLFSLLFVGRPSECLPPVSIVSLGLHSSSEGGVLFSSFYRKGNWGLELSNLFEVILSRICIFIAVSFIPPFSHYQFYPSSTGHNMKTEVYRSFDGLSTACCVPVIDLQTTESVPGPMRLGPLRGAGLRTVQLFTGTPPLSEVSGRRGQDHTWRHLLQWWWASAKD